MKGNGADGVEGSERRGPLVSLERIGLVAPGPVPTRILHPLDLEIAARSGVAIMGPSGAGKTSLASIIGALQVPTEGSYRYDGVQVVGRSASALARLRSSELGFVFQHSHLIEERSAIANVSLGITDARVPISDRLERSRGALDLVELSHLADRRAGDLSGGERHRVAIARALVKAPRMVIADEPTAALDQRTGRSILELLRRVTDSDATLILVTHDRRARDLVDEVVNIVDGRRV